MDKVKQINVKGNSRLVYFDIYNLYTNVTDMETVNLIEWWLKDKVLGKV